MMGLNRKRGDGTWRTWMQWREWMKNMKRMKRRKEAVGTWLVGGGLWIALSLLILLMACPSWGATYHVRADGTVTSANKANATSCRNASTALSMTEFNATTFSGGDKVNFCTEGGNFSTTMVPISNGTSTARITYDGDADGDGVYAHITGRPFGIYLRNSGAFTTIQHFEISNCTEGIQGWAETTPLLGAKFLSNKIHGMENRGIILIGEADTVESPANYYDGAEIAYNEIYANGTNTIGNDIGLSRYTTNTHIHNNKLYGTESKGVDGIVFSYAGRGNIVEYNKIHDHNMTNAGEDGIDIKKACYDTPTQNLPYNVIRYNEIYGHTRQTGITVQFDSQYVKIYGNNIYGNMRGIWMRGPHNLGYYSTRYVDVYYNSIHNNLVNGIQINDGFVGDANLYNNTIYGNGSYAGSGAKTGICILEGSNYIVKNNILAGNMPASGGTYRSQIYVASGPQSTTELDYNLYYHPDGPVRIYWDSVYRSLATLQGTYSQDINGQENNPHFVSSSDFRLLRGSPAINAGVNVCTAEGVPFATCTGDGTGTWTDIKGSVVPHNGKISIGAYQFTSFDTEQGESAARKSWRRVFRKF